MQTILGAGGVIGRELSQSLLAYTNRIRQVSRAPKAVNPADELVAADLLHAAATSAAVAGSEVCYLVAGLKYDTRVWQAEWPVVMRNVLEACKRHQSARVVEAAVIVRRRSRRSAAPVATRSWDARPA